MITYYTLSNGEKISIFFWDDYWPGAAAYHDPVEVIEIDMKNGDGYTPKKVKDIRYPGRLIALQHNLKLYTSQHGQHYILWKGLPVYLDEFDYRPLPILIQAIETGKALDDPWFVNDNILASLMKQPDKFGVSIIDEDEEVQSVIFIPKLEPLREVTNWYYKIKFQAKDKNLRTLMGTKDYYFSDFCSLLKNNCIKLVQI